MCLTRGEIRAHRLVWRKRPWAPVQRSLRRFDGWISFFQRTIRRVGCTLPLLLGVRFALAQNALQTEASFRLDVMAVLSKAGCSAGTCHGNKNGKGGFKLSLRGQDPNLDYLSLTRDLFSRRVSPLEPEQSLILLKPTTQLAHEGGLRFQEGFRGIRNPASLDYQWNAERLGFRLPKFSGGKSRSHRWKEFLVEPDDRVQLQVRGRFSDGTTHDITSLAVYESVNRLAQVSHDGLVQRQGPAGVAETTVLVRCLQFQEPVRLAFVPERSDFTWQKVPGQSYIDDQIFRQVAHPAYAPVRAVF